MPVELAEPLKGDVSAGDAVVVKSSLGLGFGKVVEAMLTGFPAAGDETPAPRASRERKLMLIWLTKLETEFQFFNLFRYITFRTGGAMFTSAVIVFLFGPMIIDSLRLRQGRGQPIRADGPQTHFKKAGTPTMGGLMMLVGIVVGSLLWADLRASTSSSCCS